MIALGFFDGVHLGHGALLRRVGEEARRKNAIPAAVTFDRHPGELIAGVATPLISSPRDRAELMRRYYGIEEVIVAPFDDHMMHLPWDVFITDFLVKENGAIHLVAGHDFHFGYKGEGTPQRLKERCAELGIGCTILPQVEVDKITVSSTYIRGLLARGELERANRFLGHPYTLTDEVHQGKRLGSTLGFPTVNLRMPPGVLVPAYGVYATAVFLEDGESYRAVTNIGIRPTVDEAGSVTVEGFLLEFEGDLYGRTLRMEFYQFLRPERRFDSLEALRTQVMCDVEEVQAFFQK